MKLVEFIKRKFLFKYTYNSECYVNYLISQGVEVGENTVFFAPRTNSIDVTRPYLLKIGKNVKIVSNVTILTHDFSYSVLRHVYHSIQNECSGYTIIGDNCFIGMRSCIMPGVQLGNNVIVATGSIVTKSFGDNLVIGGVPAKVICTLDEFYIRRKDRQVEDAFRLVNIIRKEYDREPTIQEMGSFYHLFLERNTGALIENCVRTKISGDNENEIIDDFLNSKPLFNGLEDFLNKSKTTD